jgi:DNA modification methylase
MWTGAFRDSERNVKLHPTLKPVSLMRWIVDRWTQPGDLVLDPYMGSGPVAQACHDLGRRYIGVEIVEDYCRVAANRLAQGVLAL